VLESDYTFGQAVAMPGQQDRRVRGAVAFKTWIPRLFLEGRFALCLDADEYLLLPPGLRSVAELAEYVERRDIVSVAASLIDFFPATLDEMLARREFPTGEAMLGAHGHFDAVPLIDWDAQQQRWTRVNESATARLFRKHRVKTVPANMQWAPRWLNRALPYRYPKTSVSKTPFVHWVDGVEYANTHRTNVEASSALLVGLAHVKFTYDLARRMDYALESKVYVRGSRKYEWYVELLDAMRASDRSFLGPRSIHYRRPQDLADAGLARLASGTGQAIAH
jgi:hypothetical protein